MNLNELAQATALFINNVNDFIDSTPLIVDETPQSRRVRNANTHEPTKFEGTGRNKPCPCGSGVKFKRCCERQPQTENQ